MMILIKGVWGSIVSKFRYIGDIHGRNQPYLDIVRISPYPTVQVGDYGCGFTINPITTFLPNEINRHFFIRGNHDHPLKCKEQDNWIPDGHFDEEHKILYVGGANSIDRMYRREGIDWWPEEQLTIGELDAIIDNAQKNPPEIIISHECPEFISDAICTLAHYRKFNDDNRTRMALQALYHLNVGKTPKLHIFGHWHVDADLRINGTRFICLNELSYIDIDTENVLDGEIVKYHNSPTLIYSNS